MACKYLYRSNVSIGNLYEAYIGDEQRFFSKEICIMKLWSIEVNLRRRAKGEAENRRRANNNKVA